MSEGWNKTLLDRIDACIVAAGGTPGARVGNWNQDVLQAINELVAASASQIVVMPADVSNSTTTLAPATGLSFTPVANGVYLFEVYLVHASASSSTGISWVIADSATSIDGTGSEVLLARGSAVNAVAVGLGSAIAGNNPSGISAPGTSSGSGYTLSVGWAVWVADASPSNVGVYFASETGGSAVTVKGGQSLLSYLRIG